MPAAQGQSEGLVRPSMIETALSLNDQVEAMEFVNSSSEISREVGRLQIYLRMQHPADMKMHGRNYSAEAVLDQIARRSLSSYFGHHIQRML